MAEVIIGKVGHNPRGVWSSTEATYERLDEVLYNGSTYVVIWPFSSGKVPAGTLPTNATYWLLSASKGDIGAQGVGAVQGIATPAGTPTGTRFIGETWTVLTANYGATFTNFGNQVVPVKVGEQYVSNARFVWNGTAWILNRELVDSPGTVDVGGVLQKINLPNLVARTIDFSLLTLTGAVFGAYYHDDQVATEPTILDTFRIKLVSAGALVTIHEMSRVPGSQPVVVYSYAPFYTTALEHTEKIFDKHVLATGNFIGYTADVAPYYIAQTGFGWRVGFTTATNQRRSYDVILNKLLTTGLVDLINKHESVSLELGLTPKSNSIPIESYILDTASVDIIFDIPSSQVTKETYGIKTRTKATVGSVITFVVGVLRNNLSTNQVMEIIHSYAPITTTSVFQVHNIDDGFVIPAGAYVGLSLATGSRIFYVVGGAGSSMLITKGTLAVASTTNTIRFAYDFTGYESDQYKVSNKISLIESATKLNFSNKKRTLDRCVLFKDEFSALTNFTAPTWSLVAGGVSPSAVGVANALFLNRKYHVDQRDLLLECTLASDDVLAIDCTTITMTQGLGSVRIDVAANIITIHKGVTNVLVAQQTLPFTWIAGRRYGIYLSRDFTKTYITISDSITGVSYSINYTPFSATYIQDFLHNEAYKIYLVSGNTAGCIIHRFMVFSRENPLAWWCGDSITQGLGISPVDAGLTYTSLIDSKINGNLLVSAMASENIDGTILKMTTEAPFIKAKYNMFTIGTNGGNTEAKLTQLVTMGAANGSKTILNHIPAMSNGNHVAINQMIDKVCRDTGAIRGMLLDVATSTGGDPTAAQISSYFQDGVHPNVTGYAAMAARFAIDVPFLIQ